MAKQDNITSMVPVPRHYGMINWIGLWNLYLKEVRRFIVVFTQTIIAPVVSSLLFLAVFTIALNSSVKYINGIEFASFLAPGLIMMAMAQNSFANTSSSLVIAKVQGNIVDILMPPLNAFELTLALGFGGATRGVAVGIVTTIGVSFFVDLSLSHPFFIIFHAVFASLMLSLLGVIGGIWAEKFDHIAAFTNFIIMPFSFLSGTFYSISRLPEAFYNIAFFNPFFYMIDGFRYGFIGVSDADPTLGIFVMLGVNILLGITAWRMFANGFNLKP